MDDKQGMREESAAREREREQNEELYACIQHNEV